MGGKEQVELKKEIGLMSGVLMVVGTIIGSGIFVSPKGVFQYAGSVGVALVVWTLCGVFSLCGGICYAELGTSIPRSGGDYAYTLEAFGPLTAFLRLWITVIIVQPATLAILSLAFATYFVKPFYPDCEPPDGALRLIGILCLLLLTYVNCRSVKLAVKVQDFFTVAKLLALGLIIVTGLCRICTGHTEHLANSFSDASISPGGLSLAFYSGLFAYGGFNNLNYVAEELKNPKRNLPLAIYIGISIVTAVYVLANVAYFTVVSPEEILKSPAVAVTFAQDMFGPFAWTMPMFVSLSTFGGLNGIMFTISRLFFIGAHEGHLPALVGMINVYHLTPTPPILLSTGFALLMFITSDIYSLINYLSFNHWLWIGVSILALLKLRRSKPYIPRPIKANLVFPILFLLMCVFLTVMPLYEAPVESGLGVLILLSGIPVYYVLVKPTKSLIGFRRISAMFTAEMQKLLEVVRPEREAEL
ncbi:Y+L amino acid transporter 2-like [Tropilaelaps mercedesae]|uniref:Y+L amino acid transporter 2-like n=1 Tax=Tropilaelaps mercedesae TaxID=418985 RepID=A0A1V9XU17_9ACAR|nr:Y+L amino acid transporter 2-like [Tropilaelaps mercedesae]